MTNQEMIMLSGYLSVIGAVTNKYRTVHYCIIDGERYAKIKNSKLRKPERNQYRRLFDECGKRGIEVKVGEKGDFEGMKNSGGFAAAVSERAFTTAEDLCCENAFFVFIDGVEDPYNFGYMLRSFYLSGANAVVIPRSKRHFFGEITAKSSAGVSESIEIAVCDDLASFCRSLKDRGVRIICAALENSVSVYDAALKKPLMLVIGGEKRGISRAVLEMADEIVRIDYAVGKQIALPAVSASAVLAFEVFRKNRD